MVVVCLVVVVLSLLSECLSLVVVEWMVVSFYVVLFDGWVWVVWVFLV